jgi:hypothetical protein
MSAYSQTKSMGGRGDLVLIGIPGTGPSRALSGAGTITFSSASLFALVPRALSGVGVLTITRSMHGKGTGTLTITGKPGPKPPYSLTGIGTLNLVGIIQSLQGSGVTAISGMNSWTVNWWNSLPTSYRIADSMQNLEFGGFPLAKYMYGIGAVAGGIRDLSDRLWSGEVMDPERARDQDLRWLAQMIGISAENRDQKPEDLRTYMRDVIAAGLPAVGTRQSITDAAKRFLIGTKQTTVIPSTTNEFELILLVKASDVPGGDLAAYAQGVRDTGIIPAGYTIMAVASAATWDQWEAASGTTWDQFIAVAETWTEADSLGVVL